jgi:hypothetical protein
MLFRVKGGQMKYALKTMADRYGEYREGKQIRAEIIAGTTIQEQLPSMQRKLRMDGSIMLRGSDDNGIRKEGTTTD